MLLVPTRRGGILVKTKSLCVAKVLLLSLMINLYLSNRSDLSNCDKLEGIKNTQREKSFLFYSAVCFVWGK